MDGCGIVGIRTRNLLKIGWKLKTDLKIYTDQQSMVFC